MNQQTKLALNQLNTVLPLKARQESCTPEIKALHQAVLQSFVTNGRILTRAEMAQQVSNLDEAITVLQSNDMVVFSEDGEPVGAYPFTMEAREHQIQVNGQGPDFSAPFGGYKQSGNGREFGEHGFEEFLEVKGVMGVSA